MDIFSMETFIVSKKKSLFLLIIVIIVMIATLSGCLYDPEDTSPDDTSAVTESTEEPFNIDDWRRKTEPTVITSDTVPENPPEGTSEPAPEVDAETTTDNTTSAPQTSEEEKVERDYVLNTNTMKFHYPTCDSVADIKDKNREDFHGAREDVVAKGYSPCGRCKP